MYCYQHNNINCLAVVIKILTIKKKSTFLFITCKFNHSIYIIMKRIIGINVKYFTFILLKKTKPI